MKHGIDTKGIGRHGSVVERMGSFACGLIVAALAGCHAPASPGTAPALVEPAVFAPWPRVTEKPVAVSPLLAMLCTAYPATDTRVREHSRRVAASIAGPHVDHSIVVRVSPDAIAAYREDRPLPAGAVVVKEKYDDASAAGPLRAYGVMIKRAAGYDPGGGDWEYAFVTLDSAATATRGRLTGCAGCHARARATDYLFRTYRRVGR